MEEKPSTPQDSSKTTVNNDSTTRKKPRRKDKSDLGADFIAPDGGWGWIVCIAAGFSNFSLFPPLQQYGLIYRQRMEKFGFNGKQITSILNVEMALSSLVGLVNGAVFRRFTFRQVGAFGSLLAFTGVLLSAFSESFVQYLIVFSAIYGVGVGLCMSASSLAINTYFKNKRRKATGYAWTLTGLGPIIFPHISLLLLAHYGPQGSILVYAALTLNSFLCSLTLQPVLWHSPKPKIEKSAGEKTVKIDMDSNQIQNNYKCTFCQYQKKRKRSIFTSQYVFNEDDPDRPGFEIMEPGTPMMARANDGWYGSKLSLAEKSARYRPPRIRRHTTRQISCEYGYDQEDMGESSLSKPNYFNLERDELERYTSKVSVNSKTGAASEFQCTCAEEKLLMQTNNQELVTSNTPSQEDELTREQMTFWQKVVMFFDLDLLKDFTFVNLAVGVSIMTFGEINFSILTPFILNSFGYSDTQISRAMSLLAGVDITVRFLGPFVLEKVKLPNQVLFGFGIIIISMGRLIVSMTDSYHIALMAFVLIGFGKGFRTIFQPLIIPSHVPLKRLPAASGLQLISHSITYFLLGPLLGLITDNFGYVFTIHSINVLACMALIFWVVEAMLRRRLHNRSN
ncbi:uncharacterized protein LOC106095861 [Stomoxys calcitrans]|uniref:Major facilitator superfamily (MFS) profile domain-containing protein n=1 Tax=Stomoxys calcitrans TaxID=35570 RepID=A0A1I8Q3V9_STOCA|nr:uncharacterized protein LOC106095861 [Stomoxys calcitrans]